MRLLNLAKVSLMLCLILFLFFPFLSSKQVFASIFPPPNPPPNPPTGPCITCHPLDCGVCIALQYSYYEKLGCFIPVDLRRGDIIIKPECKELLDNSGYSKKCIDSGACTKEEADSKNVKYDCEICLNNCLRNNTSSSQKQYEC